MPEVNPRQRLLCLEYPIAPGECKVGENRVAIRIAKRAPHGTGESIAIEKVEVHVEYV